MCTNNKQTGHQNESNNGLKNSQKTVPSKHTEEHICVKRNKPLASLHSAFVCTCGAGGSNCTCG